MDKEDDFFGGVLKIALGIALGGLILWIAAEYYMRFRVNQAAAAAEDMAHAMVAGIDEAQRRSVAAQAARKRAEAERARLNQMRRGAAIQATADREMARQRAEVAKAAAWTAFYQPSSECLAEASVECGNAHIRARREFERRYASGEL